jgi:hypothetical protein
MALDEGLLVVRLTSVLSAANTALPMLSLSFCEIGALPP